MALALFDIQNSYYISNPNLLPFFVLLFFYFLTKLLRGRQSWVLGFGLGLVLGVVSQLHPTALLLLPLIFLSALVWRWSRISIFSLAVAGATTVAAYLPYLFFEIHNQFKDLFRISSLGSYSFGFVKLASLEGNIVFWNSLFFLKNDFFNLLTINRALFLVLLPFYVVIPLLVWWIWRRSRRRGPSISVAVNAEGKFLLVSWFILGTSLFIFYQGYIAPFYFLILWPLPAFLLAWLVRWLQVQKSRLAVYVTAVFLVTQILQLSYFYRIVEQPQYNHWRLLGFFQQIAADAGSHSFGIVNATDQVNLFLYYLRLSGLYRAIQPKAEFLYLVYNTNDLNLLTPNLKRYREVRSFGSGEFAVIKYQRTEN